MIKIYEALKVALIAIWANKGRAFLTMLGMIIGISSVVSLIAVGQGVKEDVSRQISGLGSNLLFVVPGKIDTSGGSSGFGGSNAVAMSGGNILTQKDIDVIAKTKGVQEYTPLMIIPGVIKYQDQISEKGIITGVLPVAQNIMTGFELVNGRYIQDADSEKNVIVIGSPIANDLFGSADKALNKEVLIGKNTFKVIGVSKTKTSGSILGGNEMEGVCSIPLKTAENLVGTLSISRILVQVEDADQIRSVQESLIKKILINHNQTEDFSVLTQEDMLDFLNNILQIMTALITAIASISLVVGGIGIMNIMLVSVSERTHEIGLRKAVGANRSDILLQFIIEAIIISIVGALIGLLLAYIGTQIVSAKSVLHPVITWYAVGLAGGISIGIGLVFGILPAIRAARKNPIDALRWE